MYYIKSKLRNDYWISEVIYRKKKKFKKKNFENIKFKSKHKWIDLIDQTYLLDLTIKILISLYLYIVHSCVDNKEHPRNYLAPVIDIFSSAILALYVPDQR